MELQTRINEQGDIVRKLKADKADKALIEEQVKILINLKSMTVTEEGCKKSSNFVLKFPKGMKDCSIKLLVILSLFGS